MKTMLTAWMVACSLGLATLAGCGDDEPPAVNAPPSPPTPDAGPTPGKNARTMKTERAMGTRPENLVLDPVFGSLGGQYSQNVLPSDATALLEAPATSPAGAAQPVLVMSPSGPSPAVLFSVQGGTGPLDVRIYVAGPPGTTVSLFDGSGTQLFDVPASSDGAQVHGDRTYRLYHASITEQLLGKVWLMVDFAGGEAVIAAPEVLSPAAPAQTFALGTPARRGTLGRAGARALAVARAVPVFHGVLPKRPPPGR